MFGVVFAVSVAVVAIAYAGGVERAVDDTLLGWVLGIMALTGFLGSLAAFLAAIVAKGQARAGDAAVAPALRCSRHCMPSWYSAKPSGGSKRRVAALPKA